MYRRSCFAVVMLGLAVPSALAQAPLRVLSSNGVRAVVLDLRAELEAAAGVPLDIEFSTAAGFKRRIDANEPFDVTILPPAMIDELIAAGRIAGPRIDVGRTGVGVGARTTTNVGSVASLEGLRAVLTNAASVAFTAEGQSRATIDAAFARLGLTEAMRAKSLLLGPGEAPEAVAEGRAELVLTLTSEILPIAGVKLIGPLPAEVQTYVAFSAGVARNARNAAAAAAFVSYLTRPEVTAALPQHGMERVPAR